jgi:ribosomal protein L27
MDLMARTNALSILQGIDEKARLSELYGYVIENVMKETLSNGLKSQAYTGDPSAGSAEFRRFANAASYDYGTARSSGKGANITGKPITVNLDIHKEIVEEVAQFDLDSIGAGNVLARQAGKHIDSMANELDIAFFEAAAEAAVPFTPEESQLGNILEEFIQALETVKNECVTGVKRNMMDIVCSPAFYGKIRNLLDERSAPNVDTAAEQFVTFHGVRFYSSVNMPAGTDAILMARGAIAQPVVVYPYNEPEKIPLSNDYSVALFYHYGVKVLTPDLVFAYAAAQGIEPK